MPPKKPLPPTYTHYPSELLTLGAGVAIFHLATARVILCYHTRDKYYFLPKGRKNAGESLERAAEREGFEESGYRCRLLPVSMKHRATEAGEFAAEPAYVQLMPLNERVQYVLFWYVAETVPPDVEQSYPAVADDEAPGPYEPPAPWPQDMTFQRRIAQDFLPPVSSGEILEANIYEPVHHPNTAQDEEEACYRSYLYPVDQARELLRGGVMEDVVRRGWEGIMARHKVEDERDGPAS